MKSAIEKLPTLEAIKKAHQKILALFPETALEKNQPLSQKYNANVYLKREDKQPVRSYKIRGAYHKIVSLSDLEKSKGVICASAGNHAQGVALSCALLGIKGTIFMPVPTPKQKIDRVKYLASGQVEIVLVGDTYDDAYIAALDQAKDRSAIFVHPFDDLEVIKGQATIALEINKQLPLAADYVFAPVGGGGLASGLSTVFYHLDKPTKIIGVEPAGAASMSYAFQERENKALHHIDKFVDGAAVKQVGTNTYAICQELLYDMQTVKEGKVCSTILEFYNEEAMVLEPAGALSLAVLDQNAKLIEGKTIVCIISGSNNDVLRMEEIKEKAMLHDGLKHYFIIRFAQRSGALRDFVVKVLGPEDDISYFQYTKKNTKEKGPALVGIELEKSSDYELLISKMKLAGMDYEYINHSPDLFQLFV